MLNMIILISIENYQSKYLLEKISLKFPIIHGISIIKDMIQSNQVDLFMDRLITLINTNFKTAAGKQVVLLMGGMGNGKSAILNMIAKSKITVTRNQLELDWLFTAYPQVAEIGHTIASTFTPNLFDWGSIRFFDMPGFYDNRSKEHEIAKSFFIKEIANSAKSIKIIVVGNSPSLINERCRPYAECFNQLKQFITTFDSNTDCSLIVTKAEAGRTAQGVAACFAKFQKSIKIPVERITIIPNPTAEGQYDYSFLNIQEIISKTPSLSVKCNAPLSGQARLRLNEINQQLNQSIERALVVYSNAVRMYYLEVMTSDITISNKNIKQLHESIEKAEQILKDSRNAEQFRDTLLKYTSKIAKAGKIPFNCQEILQFINRKIQQISYINKQIDKFQFNMNYWMPNINFRCQLYQKSQNKAVLKNIDILKSYLQDNLNIDINLSIRNQAHAFLNKPNRFQVQYSGSKRISGNVSHTATCSKDFYIPYTAEIQINQNVPYSGYAKYKGTKQFDVTVQISYCQSQDQDEEKNYLKPYFPTVDLNQEFKYLHLCQCKNAYKQIVKKVSTSYEGQVYYSGSVHYITKETQIRYASFRKEIRQQVTKPYSQLVPYSGQHTAVCQEHHICSCQLLAEMVFTSIEIYEDCSHIQSIIEFQRREIARLSNIVYENNQEDDKLGLIISQLNICRLDITNYKHTKHEIANKIHDKLTSQLIFTQPYTGSTSVQILKPYNQVFLCQGSQYVSTYLTHKAHIPYTTSQISYSKNIQATGHISFRKCRFNCWLCKKYDSVKYEENLNVTGKVQTSGTVQFKKQLLYSRYVPYNEQIPYAGIISKVQTVPYEVASRVTCESSKDIGSGHHSCTSCSAWETFVKVLKELWEVQYSLIEELKNNKEVIRELLEAQAEQVKRKMKLLLENQEREAQTAEQ